MKINKTELEIIHEDILTLDVGAVVNPCGADCALSLPLEGLVLQKDFVPTCGDAKGNQSLPPGSVVCAKEQSPRSRYVIHAVKINNEGKTDEMILRQTCRNVFVLADKLAVDSIAFIPLVETQAEYSILGAAKVLAQEILKYVRYETTQLKRVVICAHQVAVYGVYSKEIESYLNHIVHDLGAGPYVTVDIIIEVPDGIVVIERSNPPYGLALPGGFVDPGESVEHAAQREAKEETGLELADLCQFHTYSSPDRDPRFHTVSTVFIARGIGVPQFGDDAQGLQVISKEKILNYTFAFDHHKILRDYLIRH